MSRRRRVLVLGAGGVRAHSPGLFAGTIDLTQAVVSDTGVVLLLFVTGSLTIASSTVGPPPPCPALPCTLPFSGTFRLPFGVDDLGDPVRADRHHAAFYLADDRTTRIPVGPDELAIRFPTVRLDVTIAR